MNDLKSDDNAIDFDEPMLSIGIVANKIGVSPETIRLYEREGLIIPYKSEKGTRSFSLHDLSRLRCIRDLIQNEKLNIAGIKRLLALIPCWDLKPCSQEERENCPAYLSNNFVCWELETTGAKCREDDCRNCGVYLRSCMEAGHLKDKYLMTLKK